MRGLIVPALLASTLWGCATPSPMTWFFNPNHPEGARLALGVPGTDDLRVLALCRPRSGEIRLTVYGKRGDPPVLNLVSGKLTSRYPGAGVEYDEQSPGAVELQFHVPADDPVLARVADTGELTVLLGRRRLDLPNGFAQQHDFLSACRAPN